MNLGIRRNMGKCLTRGQGDVGATAIRVLPDDGRHVASCHHLQLRVRLRLRYSRVIALRVIVGSTLPREEELP